MSAKPKNDPTQGRWVYDEGISQIGKTQQKQTSFLEANQKVIIAVSGAALLAIGALVAGGVLLYLKMNTTAAWSLIGSGGGVLIVDSIILGVVYYRHRHGVQPQTPKILSQSYHLVTWNIGTWDDYSSMCLVKQKMQTEHKTLADAFSERMNPPSLSEEEKKTRKDQLRTSFQQFGNPDLICLQESWQMEPEDLQFILPEGYTSFSYKEKSTKMNDCTVAWNTSKFSKIGHAAVIYDPEYIPGLSSIPDTIVLLIDNISGATLCVGSSHLRGFSLALENESEKAKAVSGDNQARYDLATMQIADADLFIFAGDFNVTAEHYPARLDIIREYGYITDATERYPTIYDANLREADGKTPKPVKLDHIFVKGRTGTSVEIMGVVPKATPLDNFDRPSDHRPVSATITIKA